MMLFSLDFMQSVFPDVDGSQDNLKGISHVVTDSREVTQGSLFIPIVGEYFDGHTFLPAAVKNGAVAALWQRNIPKPEAVPADFLFFYTEDTLLGMQKLAKAHRERINPVVIGITGSNGKTTTKDVMYAVLKTCYKTHATTGNYNNHIGLPLTMLQMAPDTEMLILEMGMNHFHEIDLLTKLAQPDYAIITNIGESHIEYLGSREGIAQAKLEIIDGLPTDGLLVIDGDEILLTEKKLPIKTICCGFSDQVNISLADLDIQEDKTAFTVNGIDRFTIPLLGKHHAKNASYVIAIARELRVSDQMIQKGFMDLTHSSMRFEQVRGKNGTLLINDAYNASASSMIAAIEVVKALKHFEEKVVVLGDILELGDKSKEMHRMVAASIDEKINYVYTYGQDAEEITNVLKKERPAINAVHFTDRDQLQNSLQKHLDDTTVILFKASRMMRFEQFAEACM